MSSERQRNSDEVFCRHCGEAIKVRAAVCPHCGVRNEQYDRSMGGTSGSTDGTGRTTRSMRRSTGDTGLESNVAFGDRPVPSVEPLVPPIERLYCSFRTPQCGQTSARTLIASPQ